MKPINVLAVCLMLSVAAYATDPVVLSFNRTGTTASDVSITVEGIDGVTAQLESVSHSLKELDSSTIICPNINGNTSPTIELVFNINGMSEDFTFNNVGLNIWALNASGGTQSSSDGKTRQFNVSVALDDSEIASQTNLDPAAGVENAYKYWYLTTGEIQTATSSMKLTLTITTGSENVGCFFGLENISLSYVEEVEEDHTLTDGIYTIKWKNNTTYYMCEGSENTLFVDSYSNTNKIFWELISTGNENCYYIRNTVTGNYIASCNNKASSASVIYTSDTPVEYYIGYSTATSGENLGCYWMSSTDCSTYSKESDNTRALNKDGASTNVITWIANTGYVGSYWTLAASEDLYEINAFKASPAIGTITTEYYILNTEGKVYTPDGTWDDIAHTERTQRWYFVGTSNNDGGYQVVAVANNAPLNEGTLYKVSGTNGEAPYTMTDADGNVLFSDVTFKAGRSAFALANQIYQMPCGSTSDIWIAQVVIGNEIYYPAGSIGDDGIVYETASKPSNKYVMYSREQMRVTPGSTCALAVKLSDTPSSDYKMVLCIDWNRDGYFEYTEELTCAKSIALSINVPEDAVTGKTRARLRLTDNGIVEPDGDVSGEIFDFLFDVAETSDDVVAPVVKVNDPARGTASWSDGVATATCLGNASFLYWQEKMHIIDVNATYEIAASTTPREITAVFSVNTEDLDDIETSILSTVDHSASIVFDGATISVENASEVKAILLFTVGGVQAAFKQGNNLSVAGMTSGMYIVKAITNIGVVSSKINL